MKQMGTALFYMLSMTMVISLAVFTLAETATLNTRLQHNWMQHDLALIAAENTAICAKHHIDAWQQPQIVRPMQPYKTSVAWWKQHGQSLEHNYYLIESFSTHKGNIYYYRIVALGIEQHARVIVQLFVKKVYINEDALPSKTVGRWLD
tara:strand:+ start:1677 stop:2123 length:447 start_codon:yes stop_codon:yes gene_type:complete